MWPFNNKKEMFPALRLQVPFTADIPKSNEKVAFVFVGGGSRGRFQAGALKWFEQIGLLNRADFIVGTSVGGLNALAVSRYWGEFNKVLDMWRNITCNDDIYTGKVDIWGVAKVLAFKFKSVLDPSGLYKVLKTHFDGLKLSTLKIPVAITTTNINSKKGEVFSWKRDIDCVLAGKLTSAIPGIFQAQEINGIIYVDGGVYNNDPIETAINLGATKVIVIGASVKESETQTVKNFAVDVLTGTLNALLDFPEQQMWQNIKEKYPQVEILYLYADKDTGDALQFKNSWLMQDGYDTACKWITPEVVKEWAR